LFELGEEVIEIPFWAFYESCPAPSAPLPRHGPFGFKATELRQRKCIVNVIFLAESKICILPPVKVVMQPTRASLLCTETEQKSTGSGHVFSVD
jgi:hypothetical protein